MTWVEASLILFGGLVALMASACRWRSDFSPSTSSAP
jgi:hypothetical protein